MKKIVLIGNPNVGKSVLFSRLTGVRVLVSNYPGTTVEFLEGYLTVDGEQFKVIDLPGTYSLEPSAPAEEVVANMLKDADIVINVVDATNLERSLYLTMELLETEYPVIVALNIYDDIKHRGIEIKVDDLQEFLGVLVIPTSGITGIGIKSLKEKLRGAKAKNIAGRTHEQRWNEIGKIVDSVQHLSHRHHTFLEIIEDASVNHFGGMLIAAAVIFASFKFVSVIGLKLNIYIFNPLFNSFYRPLTERLSATLGRGGFWHDIIIGRAINGEIDFERSMGILTTAPYIELVVVLPYVFTFYLLLSFLEDIGYIPRLALLLDNIMHSIGLHGFAIIPVLLGFGCNVPGILGTRILESKRERFIASFIISIGVPCAALQAMIFGLLGKFGGQYVVLIYLILFSVWLLLSMALNHLLKGYSPELLIEIPPYRWPLFSLLARKIVLRIRNFLIEALPIVFLSILLLNILQQIKALEMISRLASPLLYNVWGLPKEAVGALVIGLLRKDIAAGLLLPLNLSLKQLIIASVVLSMSFPCLATLVVFLKELGIKMLLKAMAIMLVVAVAIGGILNLFLS